MSSPYGSPYARLMERCQCDDGECWIGTDHACRYGYQRVAFYIPGMADLDAPRTNNRGMRKLMSHLAAWCWVNAGCQTANDLWLAYCEVRASGCELDHLCNEPGCRRPDHLELVTKSENNQRRAARRREAAARAENVESENPPEF